MNSIQCTFSPSPSLSLPTYLLRPQPHDERQGYAMLCYAILCYAMLCYAKSAIVCMYVCTQPTKQRIRMAKKNLAPQPFPIFFLPPLSLLNRPNKPQSIKRYHIISYSFTITRTPRRARLLLIYFYYIVARHHRELGLLQRGPQFGVARVDELGGFQLGFVAYPARHGTLASWNDFQKAPLCC